MLDNPDIVPHPPSHDNAIARKVVPTRRHTSKIESFDLTDARRLCSSTNVEVAAGAAADDEQPRHGSRIQNRPCSVVAVVHARDKYARIGRDATGACIISICIHRIGIRHIHRPLIR